MCDLRKTTTWQWILFSRPYLVPSNHFKDLRAEVLLWHEQLMWLTFLVSLLSLEVNRSKIFDLMQIIIYNLLILYCIITFHIWQSIGIKFNEHGMLIRNSSLGEGLEKKCKGRVSTCNFMVLFLKLWSKLLPLVDLLLLLLWLPPLCSVRPAVVDGTSHSLNTMGKKSWMVKN